MHTEKFRTWLPPRQEIVNISRARAAGARSYNTRRGANDQKWSCTSGCGCVEWSRQVMCVSGKAGHLAKDCWQGQGWQDQGEKRKRRKGREGQGKQDRHGRGSMQGVLVATAHVQGLHEEPTCSLTGRRSSGCWDGGHCGAGVGNQERASWQQPSEPEAIHPCVTFWVAWK